VASGLRRSLEWSWVRHDKGRAISKRATLSTPLAPEIVTVLSATLSLPPV